MTPPVHVREIAPEEFEALGKLLVDVYAGLEGFPSPEEQPGYYTMLANIGSFTEKKDTRVLVALNEAGAIIGGVVYFGDMAQYGSGGTATAEKNASGIRLLGVSREYRGIGAGKALACACIQLAREADNAQVILHTTDAMQAAWKMYEQLGFQRSHDLDFMQVTLPVFGFRLPL